MFPEVCMKSRNESGSVNIAFLNSLIPQSEKLYIWCYEEDAELQSTTCPEHLAPVFDAAFHRFLEVNKYPEKAEDTVNYAGFPYLIGSPIGLQWAVTGISSGRSQLFYAIGPVFYEVPEKKRIQYAMRPHLNSMYDTSWFEALLQNIGEIAVLSYAIFTRYVLLVHNSLTGESLGPDTFVSKTREPEQTVSVKETKRDRTKIYLAEQAMLDMVRNGDINYQSILGKAIVQSPGVPVHGNDPLRQMKTSIVVFTTLVSRAAMEGGLSPEIAYALGDSYIQSTEDCRDSAELSTLAASMYHDFIYRVHDLKRKTHYSPLVQKCCDYIELSLERKIRIADIAALTGYSEYYLSEKFHAETGVSMNTYIRNAKLERGAVLLRSTDLPVQKIADTLAFNTVNYFIQCFKEYTGKTPAQYRRSSKNMT